MFCIRNDTDAFFANMFIYYKILNNNIINVRRIRVKQTKRYIRPI